jgi:predicted alpha/beta hydrolase family esterase
MNYQILFIQGAGNLTTEQEQVIVDGLSSKLGNGLKIILPPIEGADDPTYRAWDDALTTNLNKLSGNVILLGHSLGGSVILKHFSMAQVPEKVIGMILFGVPYWKDQNWDVSEYEIQDEFVGKLRELNNVHFYHSTDDEVIPEQHFNAYQKLIPQAHWRVLSGMDHSYHGAVPFMVEDIHEMIGTRGKKSPR